MDEPVPAANPVPPIRVPATLADLTASLFELFLLATEQHWNVTGPQFFELHRFFGKERDRLFLTLDRIAELRRALGEVVELDLESEPSGYGLPSVESGGAAALERSGSYDGGSCATAYAEGLEMLEQCMQSLRGSIFVHDFPLMTLFSVLDQISEQNHKALYKVRSFAGIV